MTATIATLSSGWRGTRPIGSRGDEGECRRKRIQAQAPIVALVLFPLLPNGFRDQAVFGVIVFEPFSSVNRPITSSISISPILPWSRLSSVTVLFAASFLPMTRR